MYKDFDMSLREMGVGDLSVGKKIYHMTEAFSGRIVAYRNVSKKSKIEVAKSLKKNIYGTIKSIDEKKLYKLVEYFLASVKLIDDNIIDNISKNNAIFLDLNRYIGKLQRGI
jgi:cytochrome b pre-mRNA-processing protein 3